MWKVYHWSSTGCYRFRELEQGQDICTVFFDYSKAFNTIPHRPLLQKLQNYGVHQQILRWLTLYLCSRTQYVCVVLWYPTCVIWSATRLSACTSSFHYLYWWHHRFTTVWWQHDIVCWRYNAVPPHLYTCWLQPCTTGYWWHLHLDHQQLAKI